MLYCGGAGQRFRSQISAADRTFHGGGPPGCGPVSGEENSGPRGRLAGTVGVDAGAGRVGCVKFFDHRGLDQIRRAGLREKLADFFQSEVDDLGARLVDEAFRGADYELDVAALRG